MTTVQLRRYWFEPGHPPAFVELDGDVDTFLEVEAA
jgi:hypothetical protein